MELEVLKSVTRKGNFAAPELLRHRIEKQTGDELVLSGYVLYIVRKKIPGASLDIQEFWRYPFNKRDPIRMSFKKAYMFATENLG
jgi:hypothetical protein